MRNLILPSLLSLHMPQSNNGIAARQETQVNPDITSITTDNFLRRVFPAVAVLGDYVYIDGGEVSQLIDGQPSEFPYSYPVNSTLSISLKESWTGSSVRIASALKDDAVPRLSDGAIWTDPTDNAFYTWGGRSYFFTDNIPKNELWKFVADGSGGGSWSISPPEKVVVFNQLVPTEGMAYANAGTIGYALGGSANYRTDVSITGETLFASPGLVSYDMNSGEWRNETAPIGKYGTMVYGRAEYVPFGEKGLLLFLGGAQSRVESFNDPEEYTFETIEFIDLATNKWYKQATTGANPASRQRFCMMGVEGPNDTYEIFIYGGYTVSGFKTFDDVFVLSMPGFVWFRADAAATPRADHSCVRVGKNQMLSVGGSIASLGWPDSLTDPDPWPQGLGVMDLKTMTWQDGYEKDDDDYESPTLVTQWYDEGGIDGVRWSSDEVKSLFQKISDADPDLSPTSVSTIFPATPDGEKGGVPIGAIVGAAVGGAAIIGLGALLYYLLVIRKNKKKAVAEKNADDLQRHEWQNQNLYSTDKAPEYNVMVRGNATPIPFELAADINRPVELMAPMGNEMGGPGSGTTAGVR